MADLDQLSPETLSHALRLATKIESDHELAALLVRIADRHPLSGELRNSYVTATNTLASSFERRQAMAALTEK